MQGREIKPPNREDGLRIPFPVGDAFFLQEIALEFEEALLLRHDDGQSLQSDAEGFLKGKPMPRDENEPDRVNEEDDHEDE